MLKKPARGAIDGEMLELKGVVSLWAHHGDSTAMANLGKLYKATKANPPESNGGKQLPAWKMPFGTR